MLSFSASSLQTRNFEFTNTEFRVYKLEISSLQTQNFEFTNSKFRVYKHGISSLQTQNFEFTNTKFRIYKLEISSLQTQNFEFTSFGYILSMGIFSAPDSDEKGSQKQKTVLFNPHAILIFRKVRQTTAFFQFRHLRLELTRRGLN